MILATVVAALESRGRCHQGDRRGAPASGSADGPRGHSTIGSAGAGFEDDEADAAGDLEAQ